MSPPSPEEQFEQIAKSLPERTRIALIKEQEKRNRRRSNVKISGIDGANVNSIFDLVVDTCGQPPLKVAQMGNDFLVMLEGEQLKNRMMAKDRMELSNGQVVRLCEVEDKMSLPEIFEFVSRDLTVIERSDGMVRPSVGGSGNKIDQVAAAPKAEVTRSTPKLPVSNSIKPNRSRSRTPPSPGRRDQRWGGYPARNDSGYANAGYSPSNFYPHAPSTPQTWYDPHYSKSRNNSYNYDWDQGKGQGKGRGNGKGGKASEVNGRGKGKGSQNQRPVTPENQGSQGQPPRSPRPVPQIGPPTIGGAGSSSP